MFSIPVFLGCGLFCLLVAVTAMRGVDGMVSALSGLVPFMIAGAVVIGVISLFRGNVSFDINSANENPLLNNWVFSAFTYASHNLFCTIGILAPVAVRIEKKTVIPGVLWGTVILLAISLSVLFGMEVNVAVTETQLPMLELAYNIGSVVGVIYAVFLLFGMFGTSLSSIVGVVEYCEQKSAFLAKYKKILVVVLCLAGWIGSLYGFGDLIGIVYPISGYFGFGAILATIIHYCVKRKK